MYVLIIISKEEYRTKVVMMCRIVSIYRLTFHLTPDTNHLSNSYTQRDNSKLI